MTNVLMNAGIPCSYCHNLHDSEQLHLITMQDCLQGNVQFTSVRLLHEQLHL